MSHVSTLIVIISLLAGALIIFYVHSERFEESQLGEYQQDLNIIIKSNRSSNRKARMIIESIRFERQTIQEYSRAIIVRCCGYDSCIDMPVRHKKIIIIKRKRKRTTTQTVEGGEGETTTPGEEESTTEEETTAESDTTPSVDSTVSEESTTLDPNSTTTIDPNSTTTFNPNSTIQPNSTLAPNATTNMINLTSTTVNKNMTTVSTTAKLNATTVSTTMTTQKLTSTTTSNVTTTQTVTATNSTNTTTVSTTPIPNNCSSETCPAINCSVANPNPSTGENLLIQVLKGNAIPSRMIFSTQETCNRVYKIVGGSAEADFESAIRICCLLQMKVLFLDSSDKISCISSMLNSMRSTSWYVWTSARRRNCNSTFAWCPQGASNPVNNTLWSPGFPVAYNYTVHGSLAPDCASLNIEYVNNTGVTTFENSACDFMNTVVCEN
ncbi:uncharacterized protein LOC132200692 [Neocloeon triangulifer]|uniref:uncharacterized protein LOC132200692 n=1 Tax=Neocloeon triangulifer TaxID=2078957 RepID=UPI00286F16BF|nr:uncharacterized protein LOC132200692 [Neocloeon triangulifer]